MTIKSNKGVQYTIDTPVPDQELSEAISVKGWVVHPKLTINRVTVESAIGKVIAEAAVEIHRPGVHREFQGYPNSKSAGFLFDLEPPSPGIYSLVAHSDNGHHFPISEFNFKGYTQRKLLFMHIAKAGGSTVNKYLASHYSSNRVAIHIESNDKWFEDSDYANSLYFISGHVSLHRLSRFLNLEDYYKITVVREPYSHLISHLAWVRKLSTHGEEARLKQHPEYVQLFAQKLLQTDLSNPVEITRLIESLNEQEKQLVDNCQTRYFTRVKPGEVINNEHVRQAINASKMFDKVGILENLHQFFAEINHDMGWQGQYEYTAENVSNDDYGMSHLDTDIRKALSPLVRHDIKLYEFLQFEVQSA